MWAVPAATPLSRRSVLRAAVGAAAIGVLVSACGRDEHNEPDTLLPQLEAARSDAALATAAAAAPGLNPATVAAYTEVAAERGKHADALAAEITRATGSSTTSSTTAAGGSVAAPAPARRDVVAALTRSAESASGRAVTESGYRAGLLGSIAASCTALYLVGLPEEPKP